MRIETVVKISESGNKLRETRKVNGNIDKPKTVTLRSKLRHGKGKKMKFF